MLDFFIDVSQIVLADIVLSGDNALIIGMAAAAFSEIERKKIIFYGLMAAAILRILFALIASYLISIPGLLLFGALLLYWVCFKFYLDIKSFTKETDNSKYWNMISTVDSDKEVLIKRMTGDTFSIELVSSNQNTKDSNQKDEDKIKTIQELDRDKLDSKFSRENKEKLN